LTFRPVPVDARAHGKAGTVLVEVFAVRVVEAGLVRGRIVDASLVEVRASEEAGEEGGDDTCEKGSAGVRR
jgi:hypothetical protein